MNTLPLNQIFSLGILSLVFTSCTESGLEEQALEIFENNGTDYYIKLNKNQSITRTPDGLQFTKSLSDKNTSETVGLTDSGKVSFQGKLKNGKPDGEWITFFPDGRPRWKGIKKEGISDGPFIMWYPEGRKKMEGSYKDGLKHGPSIMWHLNGMKWREQNHQNGKPVGVWKSWNDRGELLEEIVHEKIPEK